MAAPEFASILRRCLILMTPKVAQSVLFFNSTAQVWAACMMKIQVNEFDDRVVLAVEGRLSGAFVPELENSWKAARAAQPDRKILVDLKQVTCIDRAGRYLLQLMHGDGVVFLRAGLAVQDTLDEIMEQHECKH